MQGQAKELWVSLCEQAATEQNPGRLMKLIAEIDRLLREKEERVNNRPDSQNAA